jgi:3-phosphoshikimate 1-carboxyvinyltransferase
VISVEPGPLTAPGRLTLPGDFSSAAFFLVAAACVPGSRLVVEGVGLNPTRTRALEILKRMGARLRATVREERWEPSGAIEVESGPLRALTLTAMEAAGVIDELPVLMVAAACATGVSRFEGLGELRVKETDRIRSMVEGLGRLGARIRPVGSDGVEVDGGRLRGAGVESAGDHRTAMSLAVAGLLAEGTTVVQGAACVSKSFPDFFDRLRSVAGSSTGKTVDNS